MKTITVFLLNFYHQFISFDQGVLAVFAPGGACKYSPSCSVYMRQMVEQHGVLKGLNLGFKQFRKCL
ncbi:hypothetical protein A3H85_03450 [Candidatus Daviesbacteria bacterium RIFCSPLOWO2_02_FULL_40_8]|uniref:Membrane protein insertion efficiency factor YidD n=1 Tax=Candidatus Daviesbacteria bacterium RIFCSPLOWO2_01_FULL_40_24 TaxID=1797787 RepID=A0A1F5MK99_9BACT|nr:MAG: hypothetical protein A2780_02225 [Candidatus Daviesbacteria bacterium RIFCSPHIGHO2_01_FULL_41_45]OGE34135.1 MAG: hypothetical protein A3C32_00890 [Candidatus Daviesbacteria bacterium RIFCSPHIGHO2_02_FULL_41_14]OGE65817.1 MAG: hypothetical protein A3B49_03395 [Candidatus Daviesbacteria bacterium RIFCSPLOWO2_01_FULL_40_24]OGE66968.1 MAG: hypothetical protein A3H85_03450 [Candidatus Daviesbacteria bacterium RIFCSPLOWO2_02_FULL_40_8]